MAAEDIERIGVDLLPSDGYPTPTLERDSELERCLTVLESYQIFSRGRQVVTWMSASKMQLFSVLALSATNLAIKIIAMKQGVK